MTSNPSIDFQAALRDVATVEYRGRVTKALGTTVTVTGLPVAIGQRCRILSSEVSGESVLAEVVGFSDEAAVLFPLGDIQGITLGAEVVVDSQRSGVDVDESLLGKTLNGYGHLAFQIESGLDAPSASPKPKREGFTAKTMPVRRDAPDPLQRQRIGEPLSTGIKAIDSLLTVGLGQRMGIFAPAGAGKSTLLAQLSRSTPCDVVVIALIGERGREVREFLEDTLDAEARAKSVLVVATSDRPALERINAAYTATAIAEGFAEEGRRVLLLMDSVTRFARAVREVGLAAGEPAVRQGFTPSVFAELPKLLERTGTMPVGSITSFYTVLTDDENADDVIAEETRSLLDGNIILSRTLAQRAHYPAIDVSASISRCMSQISDARHSALSNDVRKSLATYKQLEFLVQVGEYEMGTDSESDKAVTLHEATQRWLTQSPGSSVPMSEALNELEAIGYSSSGAGA